MNCKLRYRHSEIKDYQVTALLIVCYLIISMTNICYAENTFKAVYFSPCPGSSSNTLQTNIIIKTNKLINKSQAENSSFLSVSGSKSGEHPGRLILSDDGKTLLFYPAQNFSKDEIVTVHSNWSLKSIDGEILDNIEFRFSTISQSSNRSILNEYRDKGDYKEALSSAGKTQNRDYRLADMNTLGNNDTLPADFPKINITISDNPDPDYIFIGTTSAKVPYLMILDNSGKPVYYKRTPSGSYDFKVQPNGLLTYYDMKSSCFLAMDSSYQVVDSFKCGNGYYTDIHELRILPNGHALILGFIDRVMDLSRLVVGGFTDAIVVGSVVQELDRNKNVVFQWRCQDYFNVTDSYADLQQNYIDFTHGNAIDPDDDGNLLVSFRNMQEITKINRETGTIIWRLGGRKNQFKFLNDTLGFSWQHAIRRLPNGNYLLFDNGFKRERDYYSRVLEYKLDESLKKAELVWQFRNTPDIYSYGLGYAQRLTNGNTFIGWGTELPTITEVRPDGTKAFELSLPGGLMTYRAYRFPWKNKVLLPEKISFSHLNYDFKATALRDTVSMDLEIKNNNEETVALNSIENSLRSFYTPLNFPISIKAKGNIKTRLYFKPEILGNVKDTFNIKYNNGIVKISLSGESPFPEMAVNKEIIDFGDVSLKGSSVNEIVLTNNSINPLSITAINFKTIGFICPKINLPYQLRNKDTLRLPITFKPDSLCEYSDTLIIRSNSSGQINRVFVRGKGIISSRVAENGSLHPREYALRQNYPNPFNQATVIQYDIAEPVEVNISIYNMLGQLIKTVVKEYKDPGSYRIFWNGVNNNDITVGSGVYIYTIRAGQFSCSQKMLMLR